MKYVGNIQVSSLASSLGFFAPGSFTEGEVAVLFEGLVLDDAAVGFDDGDVAGWGLFLGLVVVMLVLSIVIMFVEFG